MTELSVENYGLSRGCYLPGKCSNYGFLDEFNFKVKFSNQTGGNYLLVPLSTFQIDMDAKGQDICFLAV